MNLWDRLDGLINLNFKLSYHIDEVNDLIKQKVATKQ